ncbi:hypothetical protein ES702_03090 [subsurface metagenome]
MTNSEKLGRGMKFTLDRKIWQASPWKLKIWIYLYEQANYIDSVYQGIEIKRGQLCRSVRQIQRDCSYKIGYRTQKPSFCTVRTILKELTKEERITQRTAHSGTLFTICNYEALRAFPETRTAHRKNQSEEPISFPIDDDTSNQIDELIKAYQLKFPGHVKRFGRKTVFKMRDIIEGALQDGISLEVIKQRIEKAKEGTPWKILSEKWIAKMKKEDQSYEKLIKLYGGKDS